MSKRFNLLFLHYPTDIHPRTWICVRGKGIKLAVEKLEKEVLQMQNWSREKLSRNIAEKFHCAHGVIKRILQGNADFYPLPIILEMARLSAQEKKVLRNIRDKITYLKVNSASAKPIKAVRSMDHNLAKILGAFMADGSLSMQFVFSSSHPQRLIAVRNKLDQNDVGYSVGYLPSRKEYYVSAQADSNTLHFLEESRGQSTYGYRRIMESNSPKNIKTVSMLLTSGSKKNSALYPPVSVGREGRGEQYFQIRFLPDT